MTPDEEAYERAYDAGWKDARKQFAALSAVSVPTPDWRDGYKDGKLPGPGAVTVPTPTHDERTCPSCRRVIEETDGNYLPTPNHAPGCDVFRIAESWEPYGVPRHCDCGFIPAHVWDEAQRQWVAPQPVPEEPRQKIDRRDEWNDWPQPDHCDVHRTRDEDCRACLAYAPQPVPEEPTDG